MREPIDIVLRTQVWHRIRAVLDVFHLLPIVAAVVIFKLLTGFGQLRELYLSYLEELNVFHLALAFVGFVMISGTLSASHYWLSTIRQKIILANFVPPDTWFSFPQVRRWTGLGLAFSPWLALAIGLHYTNEHLNDLEGKISNAIGTDAPELAMRALRPSILATAVLVVAVGAVVAYVLDRCRERRGLVQGFVVMIVAIIAVATLAPVFGERSVWFYRWIGPLATLAIALLFVLLTFTLLAVLSRKSNFPAFTLILVAIAFGALFDFSFASIAGWLSLLCLLLVIAAWLSRLGWVASVSAVLGVLAFATWYREGYLDDGRARTTLPEKSQVALQARFTEWLRLRRTQARTPAEKRYPVFIVAVEGGGIFAATAASLFMARLQNEHPDFARHVFAISGVSGGAIGASLFQSFAGQPDKSSIVPPDCESHTNPLRPDDDDALSRKLSKVVQDDHFSPVVGSIIRDFLWNPNARARALESSFVESVRSCDVFAAQRLRQSYGAHWTTESTEPALVLNATWAETGYRVAFAPFGLKGKSAGTLYSFFDAEMPRHDVSLVEAAVASARFPGILPPYTYVRKPDTSDPKSTSKVGKLDANAQESETKWHFVDGGYADSSGAATALDLYRILSESDAKEEANIRVILLTSSTPVPNFRKVTGTAFRETLAPISAILEVRKGLGNQAVARVCEYLRDECKGRGAAGDWRLRIVRLEEDDFGLPLGWKVSNATFGVLRAMVARPKLCKDARDQKSIIRDNNCIASDVQNVLSDEAK